MSKFELGQKVKLLTDYIAYGHDESTLKAGSIGTVYSSEGGFTLVKFPIGITLHMMDQNFESAAIEQAPPHTLGTNPKDLLGIKKVQLNLVPPSSLIYQALAMEDGAKKYGPFNWRENKVIASIYVAAAQRHLLQWLDGEELTSDTKVPNLGAALACVGIIVDAMESGNLVDDRPKPGPASRLIDELAAKKSQQFAAPTPQVNEATKKED